MTDYDDDEAVGILVMISTPVIITLCLIHGTYLYIRYGFSGAGYDIDYICFEPNITHINSLYSCVMDCTCMIGGGKHDATETVSIFVTYWLYWIFIIPGASYLIANFIIAPIISCYIESDEYQNIP